MPKNTKYLKLCSPSENEVIIQPETTEFTLQVGDVLYDKNRICWRVIQSADTVTTSYDDWGAFTKFRNNSCVSCVSENTDLVPRYPFEFSLKYCDDGKVCADDCDETPIKARECPPPPGVIFPLTAECVLVEPSVYGVADGSIDLNINGGTKPYTVIWTLPDGKTVSSKKLENISSGVYTATVSDYFKDFTITTTCELEQPDEVDVCFLYEVPKPTATPTPTPTNTPTPTPTPVGPDICPECNFGLSNITNVPSRVSVGEMTGTCANITDYLIEWYGPDSNTKLAFTSGFGSQFEYDQKHPMTGDKAYPVLPGTYKPKLVKVIVGDKKYSSTPQNGFETAQIDCLTTIKVDPYTCSNGNPNNVYSHTIKYIGESSKGSPGPAVIRLNLETVNNKYLALNFNTEQVYDTLTIKYYRKNDISNPFIIENISVGQDIDTTDLTPNVYNKKYKTSIFVPTFSKVLSFENIPNRSNDDYLEYIITPNPKNSQTTYTLDFKCLTSFSQNICYDSVPIKIIKNTVTGKITKPTSAISECCPNPDTNFTCNLDPELALSSCTYNQYQTSDVFRYLTKTQSQFFLQPSGSTDSNFYGIPNGLGWNFNTTNGCFYGVQKFNAPVCRPVGNGTITVEKSNTGVNGTGILKMTFTNKSDFDAYYDDYLNSKNNSFGVSNNPSNPEYYRFFTIIIPNLGENNNCGDGNRVSFDIHTSSQVTFNSTTSPYTLQFTMPTITNQIPQLGCPCNCCRDIVINPVVNTVNGQSTGTSNVQIIKTNKSSSFVNPIYYVRGYNLISPVTAFTMYSTLSILKYSYQTYVFSKDATTLLPTYSATSAPMSNFNLSSQSDARKDLNYLVFNLKPCGGSSSGYTINSRVIVNNIAQSPDVKIGEWCESTGLVINSPAGDNFFA